MYWQIRISSKALLAVLAVAALSSLLTPAAEAAPPVTFAKAGDGAGRVDGPSGIAVSQVTGAVYVADAGNQRVNKFDSGGNFLLAWGAGVADGTSTELQTCGPQANPPTTRCFRGASFVLGTQELSVSPTSVAVDQSSGDVYVAESSARRVSKFTSGGEFLLMFGKNVNKTPGTPTPNLCTAASGDICGAGLAGAGAGEFFTSPRTVVVDDESRIWVGDDSRIVQFDSGGNYVSQAALPAGVTAKTFAYDSVSLIYAVKSGANETQQVNYSGFSQGDTYILGNLPGGCSSPSTEPIKYEGSAPGGEFVAEALQGRCGGGNLIVSGWPTSAFETQIRGRGKFLGQNLSQLTCETVSGAGTCSVSTIEDGAPGEVLKLEASGSPVDTLTIAGAVYSGAPVALTLDAADNLYVGDGVAPYRFKVFNPAGEQVSQFGAGQVIGSPGGTFADFFGGQNAIAIGETAKALYSVAWEDDIGQIFALPELGPLPGNERAEDVLPTTATLAATLNPEGDATTYYFEYGTDQSYGTKTTVQALPGAAFDDEAVEAQIEELLPETTYHFRLVATNNCNPSEPAEECTVEGEDTTFTTRPAVDVQAQWATDVTSTNAIFHGKLDPLGEPATWWVEYGPDTSYGQTTPELDLGSGFGAVSVSAPVSGLEPDTTYHYRFAARDERDGVIYTVHGPDRTITTQPAGLGFALVDRRAWEMVSPPNKLGGNLIGSWRGLIQAAVDGNGIAYLSLSSVEADPEGNRAWEASSVLAQRGGGGEWSSNDITPPHGEVVPLPIGELSEFKLFSAELEAGVFHQRDSMPLDPQASERTPYLRHNSEPPSFTPLLHPGNVPPGFPFGGDPKQFFGSVTISGATSDLGQVILKSSVPLAEGVPPNALYRWSAGDLEPVSVLPGGGASAGTLGSGTISVRGAISVGGSRLFWSGGSALYLRDTEAGQSVRLDIVQPGAAGTGGGNPVFQGASKDGAVAFFTDSRQLTADASPGGRDLYRCELGPGATGCTSLTDISAPLGGSEESAQVQGVVSGFSEDGSSLYFVARGILDPVSNEAGDVAVAGEPNLYQWSEEEGVRFIATLASGDAPSWGSGAAEGAFRLAAAASTSGRYFTFMSQRDLTGEHPPAGDGEEVEQVFLYDASTDSLICASCRPSGAAADGEVLPPAEALKPPLVDQRDLWPGRTVAAILPEASSESETPGISLYRPRALFDNGRLFYNAVDPLVAADTNGAWDIYQYEPVGVGDCSATSGDAGTAQSAGGCVSLISSGTGEETAFLDASETGDDVFFLTTAQLSVNDTDEELDVYDARVDGVVAELEPTPECLGEACRAPSRVPEEQAPASAGFVGPGNLAERPNCGAIARRAAKLSRRAKKLGRRAKEASNPVAAKRARRQAARLQSKAERLGKQAERCRRGSR